MSARTVNVQGSILRWGLRFLSATWRYREEIPPECLPVLEGREMAVIAFWHGRMLPVWYRFRGGRFAALVSGSRDGELLAGYLSEGLGYGRVIRGSSSRGGSQALAAIVDVLGERSCLLTPDGPRGPACQAKAGALVAAVRAGRRVMAVGWRCRRSWRVRSWDRMEIPYPFSKVYIRYCIFADINNAEEEKERNKERKKTLNNSGANNPGTVGGMCHGEGGNRENEMDGGVESGNAAEAPGGTTAGSEVNEESATEVRGAIEHGKGMRISDEDLRRFNRLLDEAGIMGDER